MGLGLVIALVRDLELGSGDSFWQLCLVGFSSSCYLGWKIEMIKFSVSFFFQLEKQILCFYNKCLLAKLLRVTYLVETLQRAAHHISISRSTICNKSGPNYPEV